MIVTTWVFELPSVLQAFHGLSQRAMIEAH